MFSIRSFTSAAIRATSSTARRGTDVHALGGEERRVLAHREFRGSFRIRTRSARVSGSSSTRIGKRPCSSGMRSDTFATWNAPAAMKSTWSVFTAPYFVLTFDPSTMGSRSRCTPPRETSGPCD